MGPPGVMRVDRDRGEGCLAIEVRVRALRCLCDLPSRGLPALNGGFLPTGAKSRWRNSTSVVRFATHGPCSYSNPAHPLCSRAALVVAL
jgi:hypothetical protein